MLGRTGGRIGSDLYPTEGKAAGIWRLSELYDARRFRLWPLELNGGQSTLNLMPADTIIEINGAHIRFGAHTIHACNYIKFEPAVKIPTTGTTLELNRTSIKFNSYKLSGGSLS
jgi:hypothetical protein